MIDSIIFRILARRLAYAALAAASLTPVAPVRAQTVNGGIVRPGTLAPGALVNNGTTPGSANFYRGDGSWQAVTGGYTLPVASASVLGGVKIGAGIMETADGTISASASSVGGAYTGAAPITVTGTVIGVNQASATQFGVMEVGPGLQAASGIVGLQSVVTGAAFAYPSSITTDNYGRVTAIAAGSAPLVYSGTAPISVSGGAISLSTTGTPGTYGDATHYPVVTTDAYGRVSGVTTQTVNAGTTSVFGASGSSHGTGLVPDPGGTAGTSRYLREDATWATVTSGTGISYLSTDPTSPSTGTVWYNATTHKLKVKEASTVYAALFTPETGKPAAGSVVDTSASLSSGLVLSYPLNEASGSALTDRSATADTGTIYSSSGVASTTGWATDATYTAALAFNGTSVGYAANTHSSATNIETLTVALAFKTSSTSALQVLYYQGQNTTTNAIISSQIYISAAGQISFSCFDSTSNSVISSSASTYADSNWHTVIATRTRHGSMTLNVDSAAQVTGTDATISTTSATSLTTLGARPTVGTGPAAVNNFPLTGNIAYLNVWNRVITSSEITTLQSDPFAMYR